MARKLKTFQTSLGFYDLAIAAPSMKAALEAWGARSNLFHQGFAKETDDPDVVAVTISRPGMVLRRPAGSSGLFGERAALPDLEGDGTESVRKKSRPAPKSITSLRPAGRPSARPPPSSSASRGDAKPSAATRRRRGKRNALGATSWSQRRRRPWTRRSGSMKSVPKLSMPNGPRSRGGSRWRTTGGRRTERN